MSPPGVPLFTLIGAFPDLRFRDESMGATRRFYGPGDLYVGREQGHHDELALDCTRGGRCILKLVESMSHGPRRAPRFANALCQSCVSSCL